MKRKTIIAAALAAALILCMSAVPAFAYFTDHHTANGGLTITTKPTTEIEEWVGQGKKEVAIKNTGDTDVYVRAGVYASSALPILTVSGNGWSASPDGTMANPDNSSNVRGWYYYETPLAPGETSQRLSAELNLATKDKRVVEENYNVIVVYEYSAIQYDENGNPIAVDWSYSYPAAS